MKAVALLVSGLLSLGQCGARVPEALPGVEHCASMMPVAVAAGWPTTELKKLSKVMWRESKCEPGAHNGKGLDDSYGLLQVNVKGYLWKGRAVLCGLTEKGDLFDPATNLRCALVLWKRSGWSPWRL